MTQHYIKAQPPPNLRWEILSRSWRILFRKFFFPPLLSKKPLDYQILISAGFLLLIRSISIRSLIYLWKTLDSISFREKKRFLVHGPNHQKSSLRFRFTTLSFFSDRADRQSHFQKQRKRNISKETPKKFAILSSIISPSRLS